MKRFIYLSAVFAAMLLMVSCSGSNSTPSAAFENYSSGMVSGDYDKLTSGIYISDENKRPAAENMRFLPSLSRLIVFFLEKFKQYS